MVAAPALGLVFTYAEMRRDPVVLRAVEDQLLAEQGHLCAYTGRQLDRDSFHIEHLLPQNPPAGTGTFDSGHDTDYSNMVACWPEPNRPAEPEYGAVPKRNWPAPHQVASFLSPLLPRAGSAFKFEVTGEIAAASPADAAAVATLEKLHLDHKELSALRRNAILGALSPGGKHLSPPQAKKLLQALVDDETRLAAGHDVSLRQFSFVIKPHIAKLAAKLAPPPAHP